MPEGYNELSKQFFHMERNVGLGLDTNTSPRDIPEGASPDTRAVLFRGGNVIPAKYAASTAQVTTPTEPIVYCVPFNTRTSRYLILVGTTTIWALSATRCINVTPIWTPLETSARWEGYMMMHGIDPVVVLNNNGLDAPYYWDGKASTFATCVPVI